MLFRKNKKTAVILLSFALITAVFVFLPIIVSAQASLGVELATDTGLGTTDLKVLITRVIRILLGFLGIIAVIVNLYAGFLWLTSKGEEEQINKAKKILLNGIIGLAIILSAYLIVSYVLKIFTDATSGGEAGNGPGRDTFTYNGGALGGGILENVYPEPGQAGVPRNVLIMVTFKEAIDPATIIEADNVPQACAGFAQGTCGFLRTARIQNANRPSVAIVNRSNNNQQLEANQVIAMTNDQRTFVFDPVAYLGSENGETDYSVNLTDQIRKADGAAAFLLGGYLWSFGVSSQLDLTPPRVVAVLPASEPAVAKNTTVQITFSEAVNAVGATGQSTGNPEEPFNNILISYADANDNAIYMRGRAIISNRFRTVEFLSSAVCEMPQGQETNSCGAVPTCFPGNEEFAILVKAASVNQNGETTNVLSGLTDASGNSLDGNGNGLAQGNPADNYSAAFSTNNELDLTPPEIRAFTPAQGDDAVPANSVIQASFNELLSAASVNAENFRVFETACAGEGWPEEISCYPEGGFGVYQEDAGNTSRAMLRTYSPFLDPLKEYNPRLGSGIKDLYQNCFNPAEGVCAEGQNTPSCLD